MELKKIGTIGTDEQGFYLKLDDAYQDGLIGLEGFSHLQIIWWADQLDEPALREICTIKKPYKPGPDILGVFATRSPMRPNPLCSTIISVKDIQKEKGMIRTWYIDGEEGTPILDIKPYLPCSDRPKTSKAPDWSAMLPDSIEASANYDWESYFNF